MVEWRTPGVVGTIQNAPLVTVQGTVVAASLLNQGYIGTIGYGGTVTVPAVATVAYMGTVGTLVSPIQIGYGTLLAQGTVTVGAGTVSTQSYMVNTNVVANATASASVAATLTTATLQNLVVDAAFGTMYPTAASVQVNIIGLAPQGHRRTGTIASSPWFSGTLPAPNTYHFSSAGPLGQNVVVSANIVSGTVTQAEVTAQQSTWG